MAVNLLFSLSNMTLYYKYLLLFYIVRFMQKKNCFSYTSDNCTAVATFKVLKINLQLNIKSEWFLARFFGSRLSSSRLSGKRLSGFRFSGFRLFGSRLSGSRLSGSRLSG